MSRSIKIYKINDNKLIDQFKIGYSFILCYPKSSKLRLNKVLVYEYSELLNDKDSFYKSADFLIDVNSYGIIIGYPYKIDFSHQISKDVYKPNIFIRCLINNIDCLVDFRKIDLL